MKPETCNKLTTWRHYYIERAVEVLCDWDKILRLVFSLCTLLLVVLGSLSYMGFLSYPGTDFTFVGLKYS